jgi:hypothetical protein
MTAPTDDLRRPRDLSQIIDTALRLYRRNFGEFLAIAAVALPLTVVNAIILLAIRNPWVGFLVALPTTVASTVVDILAATAIARTIADIADGLPADFYRAYRQVLGRLGDLLLAGLRVLIPLVLISVTIVGIPFAIYLSVRWAFVSQAVVIENQSPRAAVSLSNRIVEGHWWRTFGIILVIVLLSSVVSGVVGLVLSPVATVAATLANSVVAVVVTPFAAGANTLLFFDLQSRERERVSIA